MHFVPQSSVTLIASNFRQSKPQLVDCSIFERFLHDSLSFFLFRAIVYNVARKRL